MGRGVDHRADLALHAARARGADRPSRIVVSDRKPRASRTSARPSELGSGVRLIVCSRRAADNDAALANLKPGSLVINATGLGKDAPGSPLSEAARFPERAVAWDLNYRGDLVFLDQARAQRDHKMALQIEDGWTYFLYGWTQVIAEVFHVRIPVRGSGIRGFVADRTDRPEGVSETKRSKIEDAPSAQSILRIQGAFQSLKQIKCHRVNPLEEGTLLERPTPCSALKLPPKTVDRFEDESSRPVGIRA